MNRYKRQDDTLTRQHPGSAKGTSLGAIIVVVVLVGGAGAANFFFMQKTAHKQQETVAQHNQHIAKLEKQAEDKISHAMTMARKEVETVMTDKIQQLEGQIADYEAAMPMFESYKNEAMVAEAKNQELQQHFDALANQLKAMEKQLSAAEEQAKKATDSGAVAAVRQREDALIDQLKKSQIRIRDQKENLRQQAAQIKALQQKVKQIDSTPSAQP